MRWWQWRQQCKIRRRAWVSISKLHTEPTWQHLQGSGGCWRDSEDARLGGWMAGCGVEGGGLDRWVDGQRGRYTGAWKDGLGWVVGSWFSGLQ